ncbi:chaplin family protein [Streptomyces sp. NBC_01450]|uniref:chaplin family protein n=1 Tax=Streptomyces sp. NBC_01450 TaxID=2903871 RepID=UPI003FCC6DBE
MAAATTSILSLYGTPVFADSHADASATDSPGVASGNSVQVPVHVPVNACGNTVNVIGALNPTFGNSCINGSGSQGRISGSTASGRTQGSPGVLSGNLVQAPVDVPVNACGNTVDVVALLNPAFGNRCGNVTGGTVNTPPVTPPTVPPVTPPVTPPTLPPVTPPTVPPVTPPTVPPVTPPTLPPVTPPTVPPVTPPTVPPVTPPTVPPVTPPGTTPTTPATPSRTVRDTIVPVSPSENPPTLAHTGSENVLGASVAGAALLIGGAILYRRGRVASRR